MPSAEPGNVMPRINRINKTTYGNNAVNHTTYSIAINRDMNLRLNDNDNLEEIILTFPDVLMPFHKEK